MIRPMLCQDAKGDLDAVPEGWAFEPKLDGFRWIVVRDKKQVRSFVGRNSSEHTGSMPEIEGVLKYLPGGTIVDGERVDGDGLNTYGSQHSAAGGYRIVLFDVLELNGTNVRNWQWHHRRELLVTLCELLPGGDELVRASEVTYDRQAPGLWLAEGFEGAVAKNPEGLYRDGRRSWDWIKWKPQETAEAEVVGHEMGKGESNRHRVGAWKIRMLETGAETSVAHGGTVDEVPLGKIIEVRHHGLRSDSGKPRHPVFVRARPDRDETKQRPRRRKMSTTAVRRNYGAMGVAKLKKVIAELEAGEGSDAYDRAVAKGFDPADDLKIARGALAEKEAE